MISPRTPLGKLPGEPSVALSKGPQRVEATFGTSQDLGGYNWTLLAHWPGPRA